MEPVEYALMDEAEARMWWYRALHARLLRALEGISGPLLDAGCGTGGLLAVLARRRPDLTLFGVEWAAVAAARAAAKSGALVARGSVNALPFADASFAAVVSADVLCHAAVRPEAAPGALGLDSLGLVEMVFAIEEEFDIRVPFNANAIGANATGAQEFDISSVGAVIAAVRALVAARG